MVNKKKHLSVGYICVNPASCATRTIYLSVVKKNLNKNLIEKWINTLFFVCFKSLCLFLPCPIKWGAGPPPHAAHHQRKGHRWKLPISDGFVCWAPCVGRVKRGAGGTAKNLGIEYIILYIISMTQNVNRFIYSPMFKYICRLYTNSLENETANVFFLLFFSSFFSPPEPDILNSDGEEADETEALRCGRGDTEI